MAATPPPLPQKSQPAPVPHKHGDNLGKWLHPAKAAPVPPQSKKMGSGKK
jgi:hypothetical protein